MFERMIRGTVLGSVLRAAWADPVVRDRYFVTPLQRRTAEYAAQDAGEGKDPMRKVKNRTQRAKERALKAEKDKRERYPRARQLGSAAIELYGRMGPSFHMLLESLAADVAAHAHCRVVANLH